MIIVTGAAGFIGSVLIKFLNDLGRQDIIAVDSFRQADKWMNLRGLKYEEFIEPQAFIDMLEDIEGCEAIFHLGACTSTTEKDMDFLYHNNVMFSKTIFSYCAKNDVSLCYATSAATYGNGEFGHDDSHQTTVKLKPLNKFAYSKQIFDEWALKQINQPTRWYGMKFFNVYGPHEYHKGEMSSLVYQGFKQIKEHGNFKLLKSNNKKIKDGEQLQDFVYVKDVVRAMIELMTSEKEIENGIYNLGTGKARSFYDVACATFKALKLESKIEYIEMPDHLKDQYQYFNQAKMDKFAVALPHFEFCTLEEGVSDYVNSHLNSANQFLEVENDQA